MDAASTNLAAVSLSGSEMSTIEMWEREAWWFVLAVDMTELKRGNASHSTICDDVRNIVEGT